ncbi:CehA/McbA family metallohydrolase [uncultured Abyssibacter sp.]|uniref:CehA/McbA family metallohydrolase n=1 Tax=uncultured Abyssibacter sp. TaxID=2320202 RepID=UPI0032B166EA
MRCSQLSPLTARALRAMLSLALVAVVGACGRSDPPAGGPDAPVNPPPGATICAPGEPMVELTGEVASSDAKTYRILPFFVAPGTGRIEVAYGWTEGGVLPSTPLTATTLDLGVWDQHGYRTAAGFRGWSGSRQGRLDQDRGPVFIAADEADRGYRPGVIEPGLWSVELGIAAVGPSGASWTVQIACLSGSGAGAPVADPVDPDHVAVAAPGWYHGDFHMHGYHSNPNAPDWDGFIEQARAADLDFLMVTEYVTGRHWAQLGPVQRANPDLLIWPGREIITYFGHANTFGETPDVIEYRHGFEDVTLGAVQQASVEAGALFGVNHPTTFEGALFENFCRGCAFQLEDDIDWSLVDTIEVQNGPARVSGSEVGLPIPLEIQNPFTLTALQLWDEVIAGGAFPTAVSGSDSKGVDAPEDRARKGYGSSATVVYAQELSRAALADAIRAGHAYVKTLGATGSPDVTMEVATADGQSGIYGDSVAADSATLTTTVTGGTGQTLTYLSDGAVARVVPILTDPFVDTWEAGRSDGSGPLGTAIRLQVATLDVITVIGNPVFLTPPAP